MNEFVKSYKIVRKQLFLSKSLATFFLRDNHLSERKPLLRNEAKSTLFLATRGGGRRRGEERSKMRSFSRSIADFGVTMFPLCVSEDCTRF